MCLAMVARILLIVPSVSKVQPLDLGGVPKTRSQVHSVNRRSRMALNTMNFYPSYRPIQVAVIDVLFHVDQ